MKEGLKQLSVEEKERQSSVVTRYLLHRSSAFAHAKHVALYLAMQHEEIDTIPLIESLLSGRERFNKHVYVPHVPMSTKTNDSSSNQMVFYELKSIDQYHTEMNDTNKFKLRQFNSVENLPVVDPGIFDLVIVPGLAFDRAASGKKVSRLGRGKGYYDAFLSQIPQCPTIGVGFNQQFLPLNESLNSIRVPYDEVRDACLNEFVCEKLVS